jgi:hypothetical protein
LPIIGEGQSCDADIRKLTMEIVDMQKGVAG